jgi:phosphoribosylformylglycinamidine cyclo-ligase
MPDNLSYAKAGVDIDASDAAKREMAKSIDRGDARVLNRMGAFASLLEGRFEGYADPVLVMKMEEPGSKQKLAFELGRARSIAYDLVNHLVNDMMVMGADPLYVQDCIICGTLEPAVVTELVTSMSRACADQTCVLVGGETSVQPGMVAAGLYILSACAVGVVDRAGILDGSSIREGDVVLAVASNGLHTNGYSLVRKLMEGNPRLRDKDIEGEQFIDVIMRPHTCYYLAAKGMFGDPALKGLAHVTGGGIQDNLNRILPGNLDARVDLSLLKVPRIFLAIRAEGSVAEADMMRTFNMGVGLTVVSEADSADRIRRHFEAKGHACYPIGKIVKGSKTVKFAGRIHG